MTPPDSYHFGIRSIAVARISYYCFVLKFASFDSTAGFGIVCSKTLSNDLSLNFHSISSAIKTKSVAIDCFS